MIYHGSRGCPRISWPQRLPATVALIARPYNGGRDAQGFTDSRATGMPSTPLRNPQRQSVCHAVKPGFDAMTDTLRSSLAEPG